MDNYGITFGPDPDHPGECIKDTDPSDGIGRYPELHGTYKDAAVSYTSDMIRNMWDAYRGPQCYDGVCDATEDAATCPYDCECMTLAMLSNAISQWEQGTLTLADLMSRIKAWKQGC